MLVSEIVRDTLPDYLSVTAHQTVPKFELVNFGDYSFYPVDQNGFFFDFDKNINTVSHMVSFPAESVGLGLPYSLWVNSALFILFLLSFALFAFIFKWEGGILQVNFKSVFSFGKPIASSYKNQVTQTEVWGEFYLLLQTVLVLSVLSFLWLWDKELSFHSVSVQLLVFAAIFVAFGLMIYLKIISYRAIGVFFLQKDMKNFAIYYMRMMEMLGAILFLPVLFYIYLLEVRGVLLISFMLLFLISRIILYVRLLNIFVKNKIGLFYFFVYLCGTEIAPYLLLYKGLFFILTIAEDIII